MHKCGLDKAEVWRTHRLGDERHEARTQNFGRALGLFLARSALGSKIVIALLFYFADRTSHQPSGTVGGIKRGSTRSMAAFSRALRERHVCEITSCYAVTCAIRQPDPPHFFDFGACIAPRPPSIPLGRRGSRPKRCVKRSTPSIRAS